MAKDEKIEKNQQKWRIATTAARCGESMNVYRWRSQKPHILSCWLPLLTSVSWSILGTLEAKRDFHQKSLQFFFLLLRFHIFSLLLVNPQYHCKLEHSRISNSSKVVIHLPACCWGVIVWRRKLSCELQTMTTTPVPSSHLPNPPRC